ncbi:acyloxyacyl hydrolase [Hydrogenovibrio sp. SC-1]|uniref:acyloxyacyl hydrolase n=1 Tax=Hydrogenovibrio sp. SC-1 TaxID=2065820 RepID=UPI000C7D73B5|nr:acyloxyacyl hydrolase [Hydrogenovibrio sp. SC-1]PLA75432.1 acyloxyacyl hydrolase [Hydrogenovibrio sp. SC-1]
MLVFKSRYRAFFLVLLSTLLPLHVNNAQAFDTSNDFLMNATIWGAVGSLGFACYQGKPPCSLDPGIDIHRLTLSTDIGSDNTVGFQRVSLGANWQTPIYQMGNYQLTGRMELNAGTWRSSLTAPLNKSGHIFGLNPVFQSRYHLGKINPYFELGGGPNWLSNATIENEFKSTQFQFGSIFGFGVQTTEFEVGYRYLHISNAGIELPNPGTDFHNLHLAITF